MPTIVPADPDRFLVVTGGPGAGKATPLEALRANGYAVAPESGRAILRVRSALGVDGHRDHLLFAELCRHRDIRDHRDARATTTGPAFVDRPCAGPGRVPAGEGCARAGAPDVAASRFRYARTVFAAPPWREIFRTADELTLTWDEACRLFEMATDAIGGSGTTWSSWRRRRCGSGSRSSARASRRRRVGCGGCGPGWRPPRPRARL
ncbi:MAG TPA: AAA family ATPase [Asanoa sp.]